MKRRYCFGYEDIAEITEQSIGAVRKQFSRAGLCLDREDPSGNLEKVGAYLAGAGCIKKFGADALTTGD